MVLNNFAQLKFLKVFVFFTIIATVVTVFYLLSEEKSIELETVAPRYIKNERSEIFKPIFVLPLSDEILEIHKRLNLVNPGHMGKGVILPENLPTDIKAMSDASVEKFKFNEFVSRLIPLDRELPDYRTEDCKKANYSQNLPQASIILSFYNEPFSMLMRTIYSVLNRSPINLIAEILLVDDASDDASLLEPLHDIIPRLPKVKILRSPSRLGLMKARMLGAANAIGPVLVVMDSHIEVVEGWLPPLLEPIANDPKTITLPGVEMFDRDTLEYKNVIQGIYTWVGGFTWEMVYTWTPSTLKPTSSVTPLPSPTMLGAAFVIRKDYFEYLGYYDDGFELWGAENLELSFKVWMCGGKMLQAMCSHIGHMFRNRPYWNDAAHLKKVRNNDRLVEVWLDDYKRFYYRQVPANHTNIGDISEPLKLKERLGCNNFQWFVDNVYHLVVPEHLQDHRWSTVTQKAKNVL